MIPLETQNPAELIRGIKNRVLLIHDVDDQATPNEPSRKVAEQLKNIELFETKALGHSQLLKKKRVVKKSLDYIKNT